MQFERKTKNLTKPSSLSCTLSVSVSDSSRPKRRLPSRRCRATFVLPSARPRSGSATPVRVAALRASASVRCFCFFVAAPPSALHSISARFYALRSVSKSSKSQCSPLPRN